MSKLSLSLLLQIGSNTDRDGFDFNKDNNYDSQHSGITSQCPEDQYCDCAIQDGQTEKQVCYARHIHNHETLRSVFNILIFSFLIKVFKSKVINLAADDI